MTSAGPAFHLGYRPSLDGLRGVAILLVLLDHAHAIGDGFGFIGVNTFFVLSGFLITCLLVQEWQTHGAINFRFFYLRRALRLLPALVAMLITFAIYSLVTVSGKELYQRMCEVFWALFYFMNWAKVFQFGPTLELAHTWSLSLEEQFYLCWPLLLLFLLKKTPWSSILCWLTLAATISVAIRIFLLVGSPSVPYSSPDRLMAGLDTRADALILGCLAGVAATSGMLSNLKMKGWIMTGLSFISAMALISLGGFRAMSPGMVYVGWLGASIFATVVIVQLIMGSNSLMHYVLENRALVYIGQISYGLYVWHYPILRAMEKYNLPWQNLRGCIPVFIVAILSFYLIESPCLRLKKRFQRTP